MTSNRLTPEHWLNAGFDALIKHGPQGLAAEPLARTLGTTKGSFYWHFKDVPAFHAALIATWRAGAIAALKEALDDISGPDQRLRTFGATVLGDPSERALRIWAQTNTNVRDMLCSVDAERHTYLTLLLRELGLGNPDFARALQASLIGLPQMSGDGTTPFDTLIDTVLALS